MHREGLHSWAWSVRPCPPCHMHWRREYGKPEFKEVSEPSQLSGLSLKAKVHYVVTAVSRRARVIVSIARSLVGRCPRVSSVARYLLLSSLSPLSIPEQYAKCTTKGLQCRLTCPPLKLHSFDLALMWAITRLLFRVTSWCSHNAPWLLLTTYCITCMASSGHAPFHFIHVTFNTGSHSPPKLVTLNC